MPEAEWIVADVQNLPDDLSRFDWVISNPCFGLKVKIGGPRYSGEADLAVIDIASQYASDGTFNIPAMSRPFEYGGRPYFGNALAPNMSAFKRQLGSL